MYSQRRKLSKRTLKDGEKNTKKKCRKVYDNPWTAARGDRPVREVEKKGMSKFGLESPALVNILPKLESRDGFTSHELNMSGSRGKILASASKPSLGSASRASLGSGSKPTLASVGSSSLASVSEDTALQPELGTQPFTSPIPGRRIDLEGENAREPWDQGSHFKKPERLDFASQVEPLSQAAGGGYCSDAVGGALDFASQCTDTSGTRLPAIAQAPLESPAPNRKLPPPCPRKRKSRLANPALAALMPGGLGSAPGSGGHVKGTPEVPLRSQLLGSFCTPVDQVIQQPKLADINDVLMKNQRKSQACFNKQKLAKEKPPPAASQGHLYIERTPLPVPPVNKFLRKEVEEVVKWQSEQGKKDTKRSSLFGLELTSDSKLENEFKTLSGKVMHGNFGSVTKVVSRYDGCIYAIKQMRGKHSLKAQCREMLIMAALSSQGGTKSAGGVGDGWMNLVRYYSGWIEDGVVCINMEFCERGALDTLKERCPEFEINLKTLREIFQSIASALAHMHALDLIHLDVKPENIFVTQSWDYKLGDFGQSNKIDSETGKPAYTIREGDSRYMSRELLREEHDDLFKSDVFSLGISIYELARGEGLPKEGPEWVALREVEFSEQLGPTSFPDSFFGMITECMHKNPEKRPTAEHIKKILMEIAMEEVDQAMIQEELDELQSKLAEKTKESAKVPNLRRLLKMHESTNRQLTEQLRKANKEIQQNKLKISQLQSLPVSKW